MSQAAHQYGLAFFISIFLFVSPVVLGAGPQGVDNGWAVNNDGSIILTSSKAAQIAQAETGWLRIEFRLVNGHSTWNSAMFGYYDTVVNNARAAGLQVIALIDYTSWPGSQTDWCANNFENTGGNGDNLFITNFVNNAVVPIVQHFQSRIQVYELWNEQSTWDSNPSPGVYTGASFVYPSNYSWILSKAWVAVHKTFNINNVTLVSGGIFGTSAGGESDPYGNSGAKYLESVYQLGTNSAVGSFSSVQASYGAYPLDAVGQHLYVDAFRFTTTNSFRSYLDLVHNIVTKYEGTNTTKKTFLTEFGWTTSAVSQSVQKSNLITAFKAIQATPYLQTAIWFSWQDGPSLNFGVLDINGANKLSYAGYTLYQQYEGRNSNGTTNSNLQAYFYSLGQSALGNPYDRGNGPWVYPWGNGSVQDYDGGSHLKLALFTSTFGTYEVNNVHGLWTYFLANGSLANFGYPTNNEFTVGTGTRQNFEKVYLTWDATNGIALHGPALPPTSLTATVGNARVILNWNPGPGAATYNLKSATNSGGPYNTIATDITTTSYTNTSFVAGVPYYYVVASSNSFGESVNSIEAIVIATNALPDVVVTAVNWSPTNLVAGTPVVFRATVKNQGSAPTPAGTTLGIGFSVDGGISYTWSATFTSALAPGASINLTADGGSAGTNNWITTPGLHTVTASADDVNRFAEGNENNNLFSAAFNVFRQSYAINSAGGIATPFVADTAFSGGSTYSVANAINTSGVVNPAPQAVYQSERWGTFNYALTNLMPGALHTVRLHFAEIFFDSTGQRVFNVSINGHQVLTNLDILADTGSKFKATVKQFNAIADAAGKIIISYSPVVDNPKSSGIEVIFVSAPTNTAPALVAIGNKTVNAGSTLTFTNSATDLDIPAQTLTFNLDPGAPAGSVIGATDGVFSWTAPQVSSPQTNSVTVRVTDNGSPVLSNTRTFSIVVVPPPRVSNVASSGGNLNLTWQTFPGKTYRLEYKSNLADPNWIPLGNNITASGSSSSAPDAINGNPQRFYRVVQVD
jgi:Malectin domain/CARDB